MKNKKAAIEMSLNLIIMLIIGMVILGLVIGFVNSLVGKGTQSFDKQLGDNEKLKLEEVKNSPDNLAISPEPSISIKKGKKTNIFIKVRAYSDDILVSPGELGSDTSSGSDTSLGFTISDSTGNPSEDSLIISGPGFNAKNGGEDAEMYTLRVADTTSIGTYYLTFGLYPSADGFDTSKTITVEVN